MQEVVDRYVASPCNWHANEFSRKKKTIISLTPIGTQCVYFENILPKMERLYNSLVVETDSLIEIAVKAHSSPADYVPKMIRALVDHSQPNTTIDGIIGYCSSVAVAIMVADKIRCENVFLLNGAFFLREDSVEKTQYEKDIDRMVSYLEKEQHQDIYKYVSALYSIRDGHENSEEKQKTRPFRTFESFETYLRNLKILFDCDICEIAKKIRTKVSIFYGGVDDYVHKTSSVHMAKHFEKIELMEDPSGGHHDWIRGDGIFFERIKYLLGYG